MDSAFRILRSAFCGCSSSLANLHVIACRLHAHAVHCSSQRQVRELQSCAGVKLDSGEGMVDLVVPFNGCEVC